jgi:hypothetical protein
LSENALLGISAGVPGKTFYIPFYSPFEGGFRRMSDTKIDFDT